MYVVTIHNGVESIPIHNSKEKLSSGKVTKGINVIDSFQFSMNPANAGFGEIYDYTTLVDVYNTNRKRYEFFGRVLYSEDSMSEDGEIKKEVICESYLGFLCDSQQEYVEEKNWTVGGLLQHIINTHNSQVESYKQFTIGEVTVTDPNDNVYIGIQRENTWETLSKKLLEQLGGEFRFRVEGDVIYLDYLVEIGEISSTKIALSRNMKSITREKDPSEVVTRLIPLGAKKTATDESGNKVETEYRLDISSVNDGKKFIDDEVGISLYGIRVKTVEFDDVTVASTLLKRGEDWLIANNKIKVSYTTTALDLSLIGLDKDDFEVCNYHPVENPLLGINDIIRVIKKTIDVCEEIKSTLEFGDNFETLSESLKRKSNELNLLTANYVTNHRFVSEINRTSTLIEQTEEKIRLEVEAQYDSFAEYTMAQLELKIGRDENDQIISMINASADVIRMQANRFDLRSQSDEGDWTEEFRLYNNAITCKFIHDLDQSYSTMELSSWGLWSDSYTSYGERTEQVGVGAAGFTVRRKRQSFIPNLLNFMTCQFYDEYPMYEVGIDTVNNTLYLRNSNTGEVFYMATKQEETEGEQNHDEE